MIRPQKQVLHQASSNNGLFLIVTFNLTLEITCGSPAVLLSVPALTVRVLLGFGLDRLRIVLNRLLPLLLHPLRQLLVQSLVILLHTNQVNTLLHPVHGLLLQHLQVSLVSLVVQVKMVLLLILQPLCMFFLLLLQQLLLQLGLPPLFDLHDFLYTNLFLCIL